MGHRRAQRVRRQAARLQRLRRFTAAAIVTAVATAVLGTAPASAAKPPDTVIDTAPPTGTTSTTATFTFHASAAPATFTCRLDSGASSACTSPKSYAGLAQGKHTFSVSATVNGTSDNSPATATWTVDTTLPSAPTGLAATTPSPTSVKLTWKAATDNTGVTGYDVFRDGSALATVGTVTTYTDSTVTGGSTHQYTVRARDIAGNVSAFSAPVTATTPTPPDTVIDSAPPAGTTSTTATVTFHSTITPATFTCKLDAGTASACTSPKTYTGLSQAAHTFTVFASAGGLADPTPATATWTVDTTPPATPTGLAATAPSATSVALTWNAATDNTGVTGYDVFRDGTLLTTVAAVTNYTDSTVTGGSTHQYAVRARDLAGNVSSLSATVSISTPLPMDPHLTRAPYLTDLVGLNVIVNFATDRSTNTATVQYGVASGTACTLTNTVAATSTTISVNGTFEYQWKARLALPVAGRYCYRVFLGTTDLLGANPSPAFTTQVQPGSSETFSFAVFGDWGQVDATGANPDQARLMRQIANSGARFAITTGDNGYPSGSQGNYGDLQQTGADTSAIFGPAFWGGVGSTLPVFPIIGNHGLARNDAVHPQFANWPQDTAVATSAGRYQIDTYCCPNGSASAGYPSAWYAFDAGNARFYVLDAAWADLNTGTGSPYANEWASHWQPTSPEYQWLQADLAAHKSGLKFAFFHYPLYADTSATDEQSDAFLQGNASLEGLLASNGVDIAFSGHAHIYERNAPAGGKNRQSLVSYVTGGGGAQVQSNSTCSANDKYSVGWSFTNNHGTSCGGAPVPTSSAQVYHFLKVTVAGSKVTVTPTDELGRTFDVQTYTFNTLPDTYIDTAPPAGTTSSTATFTFHASATPATFTCKLDAKPATTCTSPVTYNGLTQGAHSFSVSATVNRVQDPAPATAAWTVDSTPPTAPTSFTATATSPFSVALTWSAATDNTGVTGYDILRDGTAIATIAPATGYVDTAVVGASTHQYAVRARDIAGNTSSPTPAVAVTTPPPPVPVFQDGFESGDLSAWTTSSGLTVEGTTVHSGTHAAEGNTTVGATYAKKTLPSTYPDAYARVWFDAVSGPSQINLLRMRDAAGNSLGYVYIETTGQLGFHDDTTGTNTLSATVPTPGWHALELHLQPSGTNGVVEIWLDNTLVTDLSGAGVNVGTAPVGQIQIGEVQSGLTYDVVFDDVAFGTARLGPVADTNPPSVPANVNAIATSPFTVAVTWDPSTDDAGVAGYDVWRDGTLLANVGSVTSYTDATVLPNTSHTYTVVARDVAGNASGPSAAATVTTPAAPIPLFSDGFESGDLSAWTTTAGLTVEGTDVRSGSFAAEGNTTAGNTFAKRQLSSTYPDAYARIGFELRNQASQVNLVRFRDTAGNSIGYVFLSPTGRVGFHDDATATNATSSTVPGPGWHALELHVDVTNGLAEIWLDGVPVTGIGGAMNVGTAPVGALQIGDTGTGAYDVLYDDVAFATTRLGPSGDTTAPSTPANVTATAPSPFAVQVVWDASTDDVGVTGYDVFRDGALLTSLGPALSYTDPTVLAGSSHSYTVRARDAAGNASPQSTPANVTTPPPPVPLFSDGFESGDLSGWTSSGGLAVETSTVHAGSYAVEGNTTNGNVFAKKALTSTYADAYARVWFDVVSQANQVNLLRFRTATGVSIGYVYLTAGGQLGFHDDAAATNTVGATTPGPGWHAVELHVDVTNGLVEIWLDGAPVAGAGGAMNVGTAPVGQLQIGETQTAQTYDVVYDDAAFATSRLGPAGDTTAPSLPANLAASPASPFSVTVTWDASTDDTGVTGYDVERDGTVLAAVDGATTTYTDATVLPNTTHAYSVRARDAAGNASALAGPAIVTTPAAAAPVFADDFESGTLAAWTSSAGLVTEGTTVHAGAFAAEGNTTNGNTFAKKTLPSTYADGYARIWYDSVSQSAQVNLLRFRTATGTSIGYLYLTTAGQLALHDDTTGLNIVSAVVPGAGWHALEVHMGVNGAAGTVEVWLDGTAVPALTTTPVDLGTVPIGQLQIGETQTGRTYDVVFDDVAFGTSRLGP